MPFDPTKTVITCPGITRVHCKMIKRLDTPGTSVNVKEILNLMIYQLATEHFRNVCFHI